MLLAAFNDTESEDDVLHNDIIYTDENLEEEEEELEVTKASDQL